MARDERKRQKALEKHRVKRKQAHTAMEYTGSSSSKVNLRAAAMWPLKECWISRNWQVEGEIVQIVVARESPAGSVAAASFLADIACMGVKSAFWRVFPGDFDYQQDLLDDIMGQQPMMKADINVAAKVLRESVAYARRWDIRPDSEYTQASKLLGDADPDASDVHVPLGVEGKPLFTAGPFDNVDLILAKLERTAGPGNYHFIAPVFGEEGFSIVSDEEDEDDEDYDDDELPGSPLRLLPDRS